MDTLIINSLIAGSVYALIVIGFNLVYGTTKFFNIAHGVFAVVGGYTVLYLFRMQGFNILLSIVIGVLLTGFIGYLSDICIFQPLRRRKASGIIMFVASLGLFTALQSVIAMMFGSQFQSLTGSFASRKTYRIFHAVITIDHILIVTTLILLTSGLLLTMKKTKFGKSIKAIGDDEEVAGIIGINTNRIISGVFFISAAIAGTGGILIGLDVGLTPTMGMDLLLKAVTAAIIGGPGNIYGGLLGAFLLGFVENISSWTLSGEWKDASAFVLLIVFLMVRRKGILGN